MTKKSFIRSLRRGLGGAIVALQNNPEREEYREIVMRYCFRNIAYDPQCEGTKGYYLYLAIKTFDRREEFLTRIAEKFSETLNHHLAGQLYDILCCFADDGYALADEAIEKKYADLKRRLPLMDEYDLWYCEREQLEKLMIRKMERGGFRALKRCIDDMGEMIINCGCDDCIWYDEIMFEAEERFGKKADAYIASANNEKAAAFRQARGQWEAQKNEGGRLNLKAVSADAFAKSYRPEQSGEQEEKVTLEQLIARAKELEADGAGYPFRIRSVIHEFLKQADEEELKALARAALAESSGFVKAALLRTFTFADFPLDMEMLFPYTYSDGEWLREAAVQALSRTGGKRLRELIVPLFEAGYAEDALTLMVSDFAIEDETAIRKYILCSKRIEHGMLGSIRDIYEKNESSTCGDILLHFYRNAECTLCRKGIVEMMIQHEVIPRRILEECQYDSYRKTRELARKALAGK